MKEMKMARIMFTVSDQMQTDLKTEAEKRGATISNLIRLYVAQGLASSTGKSAAKYAVLWGGDKTKAQKRE
jgi:hypothetical protein